jgi:hypothetical protein
MPAAFVGTAGRYGAELADAKFPVDAAQKIAGEPNSAPGCATRNALQNVAGLGAQPGDPVCPQSLG